jgi:hypothetical protein
VEPRLEVPDLEERLGHGRILVGSREGVNAAGTDPPRSLESLDLSPFRAAGPREGQP